MLRLPRIHWAIWLGATVVLALGSVVLLWGLAAERQRAATDRVLYLGGSVRGTLLIGDDSPRHFNRYVRGVPQAGGFVFLDEQWWLQVHQVTLNSAKLTDADLDLLAAFPHLRELSLANTGITGAGLEQIAHLPHLAELSLSGTAVRDDDLAALSNLSQLHYLALARTPLTGRGLRHLQALPALRNIDLSQSQLDREGLAAARDLKQVTAWNFNGVPLSSEQLKTGLLQFDGFRSLTVQLTPEDERELTAKFPKMMIFNP